MPINDFTKKLFEPANDFTSFAVQNALLIASLIYIASIARWNTQLLIGSVYAVIFLFACVQTAIEWLQGNLDDEVDDDK